MNQIASESVTVMPVERTDGTYALRLCLNQGELSLGMMRRVMDVMAAHGLTTLRATTGQRMNLEGIPKDRLNDIVNALGVAVEKCPPGVSVCPGRAQCKYGRQDTRGMGDRLTALIKAHGPYPFKIKSGVSGCRMGCGLSFVRDIGLIAGAKGWELRFGGCATRKPDAGILLGNALSEDDVLRIVRLALHYYKENGKKSERISGMVRRLGHETVAEELHSRLQRG